MNISLWQIVIFGVCVGLPSMLVAVIAVIFWYRDHRQTTEILTQYKKDVAEIRQYYVNNASLVKRYNELATDLVSVITLNTQTLTRLSEQIQNNTYCPSNKPKNTLIQFAKIKLVFN